MADSAEDSEDNQDPDNLEEIKSQLDEAGSWNEVKNSEKLTELMELYPENPDELSEEELKEKQKEIKLYAARELVEPMLGKNMDWCEGYLKEVPEEEDSDLREQTGILRGGMLDRVGRMISVPIGTRYQFMGRWYSRLAQSGARKLGREEIKEHAENYENYNESLEDKLGGGIPGIR